MAGDLPRNRVVQQLDLLLSGTGYNYYKAENLARADDLLIRERAAGGLSQAVTALSDLHRAYHREFIPPSTREHPFPPADEMQRANDIIALRNRISTVDAAIRGMAAPGSDKIWRRFRTERGQLEMLLNLDYCLINLCERIRDRVHALTPSDWRADVAPGEITAMIGELETIARERRQLLMVL